MADISARDLMAILARLKPGGRYRISEIAASIGVDAARLKAGLELLSVCGVAPYGPGDCLPLIVSGELLLVAGDLPGVRGPVRLSRAEARALAAALQAAGFLADEELTRRLLAAAATDAFDPSELERTVRAAIEGHSPEIFEVLSQATAGTAVVRIAYTRAGATVASERDIEPVALYAERGAWYVTAWCRRADEWRTFRVDRISSASLTGERFSPRDTGAEPVVSPGSLDHLDGLPRATLRFSPDARFDEREWPGASVIDTAPDGHITVEVPYGGTTWIARHVAARLGSVEVLKPAEVRDAVAEVARATLASVTG